jgi:hypothetical protein
MNGIWKITKEIFRDYMKLLEYYHKKGKKKHQL